MVKAIIIPASNQADNALSSGASSSDRIELDGFHREDKRVAVYRKGKGPEPFFLKWNYTQVQMQILERGNYNLETIWVNNKSLRKRFQDPRHSSIEAIINKIETEQQKIQNFLAQKAQQPAQVLADFPFPPVYQPMIVPQIIRMADSDIKKRMIQRRGEEKSFFYPRVSSVDRPAIQVGDDLFILCTQARKRGDEILGKGGFKQVKTVIHYKISEQGVLDKQPGRFAVAITRFEKKKDGSARTKEEIEQTRGFCETEAAFLRFLKNVPNIIQIHADYMREKGALGKHGQRHYLILDLAKISLFAARKTAQLPEDKIALGAKIAESVAQVHQREILHRDIKSENILLNEQGEPFLSDFGLSSFESDEKERTIVRGTLIAPEQGKALLSNDRAKIIDSNTYAADNFALGLTLLELYAGSGRIPGLFDLKNYRRLSGIDQATLDGEISHYNIPENLLNAFKGLLSVDPKARITAKQAADNLRRLSY